MPLPLLSRKKDDDTSTTELTPDPVPTASSGTPVKRRRRPRMLALGIALLVVGALGAWWITDRLSTTSQVVVAAADVPEGQVITADDLTTSDVNVPSGSAVIAGSELDSLVGQRATTSLQEGALLAPSQISSASVPAEGTAIVGIRVTPGQIPIQNVDPGDAVQVVGTPKAGDDPPSGDAPAVNGTIQAVGEPAGDGSFVVDILVSDDQAGTLTALSATGRIGVILVPEEA